MPVPGRTEQAAIVEYLDRVRETFAGTVRRIEDQIGLLREYRQVVISAAVTGQIDVTKEAA